MLANSFCAAIQFSLLSELAAHYRLPFALVRETAATSSKVGGAELIRICFAQMRVVDEEPSSACDVHHF